MTAMSKLLVVDSPSFKFATKQEADLQATLEQLDRASDSRPLDHVTDVTMRADGVLGCGLRLTSWALYQICQAICPGLNRLLTELTAGSSEETRLAAVGILNQLVRLRFHEKLAGQLLLCDRVAGRIDALVSPKYRFLSNLNLYQQTRAAADALGPTVRLAEAVLNGRWLLVRYYVTPAAFVDGSGDRYHTGFHFSNHEGGRASLRAGNVLLRARGMVGMLTPFTSERHLRHHGRPFLERWQALLQTVLAFPLDTTTLAAGVTTLAALPLGLGSADTESEDRRRRELVQQLVRRDVPRGLAARALAQALVQPHAARGIVSVLSLGRKELAARTVLDLVIAACREARAGSIAVREKVEQMAYACALGRFRLR
jgi:hypothetical protein